MEDRYFFKHYFHDRELFERIWQYYDSFDVGENELEGLVKNLDPYGYRVNVVEEDEICEYTVVINIFEKHAGPLKETVDSIEMSGGMALVLKDKVAKEEALDRGKEPDDRWIDLL